MAPGGKRQDIASSFPVAAFRSTCYRSSLHGIVSHRAYANDPSSARFTKRQPFDTEQRTNPREEIALHARDRDIRALQRYLDTPRDTGRSRSVSKHPVSNVMQKYVFPKHRRRPSLRLFPCFSFAGTGSSRISTVVPEIGIVPRAGKNICGFSDREIRSLGRVCR